MATPHRHVVMGPGKSRRRILIENRIPDLRVEPIVRDDDRIAACRHRTTEQPVIPARATDPSAAIVIDDCRFHARLGWQIKIKLLSRLFAIGNMPGRKYRTRTGTTNAFPECNQVRVIEWR